MDDVMMAVADWLVMHGPVVLGQAICGSAAGFPQIEGRLSLCFLLLLSFPTATNHSQFPHFFAPFPFKRRVTLQRHPPSTSAKPGCQCVEPSSAIGDGGGEHSRSRPSNCWCCCWCAEEGRPETGKDLLALKAFALINMIPAIRGHNKKSYPLLWSSSYSPRLPIMPTSVRPHPVNSISVVLRPMRICEILSASPFDWQHTSPGQTCTSKCSCVAFCLSTPTCAKPPRLRNCALLA